MKPNFVIKIGKIPASSSPVLCLFILYFVFWQKQIHIATLPLMLLLGVFFLTWSVMLFRWTISFAVFLDIEKQELILNHSLFFRKKKISLKDIKEVDSLNGNIILFDYVPLSKWQKIVCKTKMSDDYTVRFAIIDAYEKIQLMNLLSDSLRSSNNEQPNHAN